MFRRGVVIVGLAAACADLKSAPADAGPGDEAGSSGNSSRDAASVDAADDLEAGSLPPAVDDSGVGPSEPCRAPVECLDPARADVIEVPTETTLGAALSSAPAGSTIQLRGGSWVGDQVLPASVSLRGCQGAVISGSVAPRGGTQSIEGFLVTGRIVMSLSGDYSIRRCDFRRAIATVDDQAAVAMATTGVGTALALVVADSTFTNRTHAIDMQATLQTGAKGLALSVENVVFSGSTSPIAMRREFRGAKLVAAVTSSTFYDFESAFVLRNVDEEDLALTVTASLFANGKVGIDNAASSTAARYRLAHSFMHEVGTPYLQAGNRVGDLLPLEGGPSFVDVVENDLRLAEGSYAVNRAPSILAVPRTDIQGCPRPTGNATDIGAYESQPARD